MSDVQQLADEEAARAEAEADADELGEEEGAGETPDEPTPDEPTPDEPTPDEPTPDEPPQAVSESEMEQIQDKLARERTRHANRVSEIMGEEAQHLQPCPLCWPLAPGFTWPPSALPAEQIAAVKLAIGEAAEPEYREAEDKQTCDECDGLTKTLTGARAGEQIALPCRKCNGQGWIAKLTTALPANGAADPNATVAFTPPQGTEDAWHRPPGHPHWGMAPASVGV